MAENPALKYHTIDELPPELRAEARRVRDGLKRIQAVDPKQTGALEQVTSLAAAAFGKVQDAVGLVRTGGEIAVEKAQEPVANSLTGRLIALPGDVVSVFWNGGKTAVNLGFTGVGGAMDLATPAQPIIGKPVQWNDGDLEKIAANYTAARSAALKMNDAEIAELTAKKQKVDYSVLESGWRNWLTYASAGLGYAWENFSTLWTGKTARSWKDYLAQEYGPQLAKNYIAGIDSQIEALRTGADEKANAAALAILRTPEIAGRHKALLDAMEAPESVTTIDGKPILTEGKNIPATAALRTEGRCTDTAQDSALCGVDQTPPGHASEPWKATKENFGKATDAGGRVIGTVGEVSKYALVPTTMAIENGISAAESYANGDLAGTMKDAAAAAVGVKGTQYMVSGARIPLLGTTPGLGQPIVRGLGRMTGQAEMANKAAQFLDKTAQQPLLYRTAMLPVHGTSRLMLEGLRGTGALLDKAGINNNIGKGVGGRALEAASGWMARERPAQAVHAAEKLQRKGMISTEALDLLKENPTQAVRVLEAEKVALQAGAELKPPVARVLEAGRFQSKIGQTPPEMFRGETVIAEQKAAQEAAEKAKAAQAAKEAAVAADAKPSWFARMARTVAEKVDPKWLRGLRVTSVGAKGSLILAGAGVALTAVVVESTYNQAEAAHARGELNKDELEQFRTWRNTALASDQLDLTGEGAVALNGIGEILDRAEREGRLSSKTRGILDPRLVARSSFQDLVYKNLQEASDLPPAARKLLEAKTALEASRVTVEVPLLLPEYYGPAVTQTEIQDGEKTATLRQQYDALFAQTLRDTAAKDYPQTIAYLDALAAGKKPEEALAAAKAAEEAVKTKPVAVAPGAEVKMGAVVQEAKPAEAAPKDEQKPDADRFAQILMEAANKPTHNPTILATGSAPDGAPVRPLAAGPRIAAQPAQLGG